MIESAKHPQRTKNMATRLETEQLQYWATIRKDPGDVFRLFRLDEFGERIFNPSTKLGQWVSYVDDVNAKHPEGPTFMFPTLQKYLRDDWLFTTLQTAKRTEGTKSIAIKVEDDLVQFWLSSRTTPDDALVALRLGSMMDILESPLLSLWTKYIDAYNLSDDPRKLSTLMSTLKTRFDDRPLHQILEKARKFPSMESAAAKLQTEKMEEIFARKRPPPPRDAFELLGLDTVGNSILSSPVLKSWKDYVDIYNKAHPLKQKSWFGPLRGKYMNDIEKLIDAGKENSRTVGIAKEAEGELHKFWLGRDNTPTPGLVYHFLFFNKPTENILTSLRFGSWIDYLKKFNERYPEKKTPLIDSILENQNKLNLLTVLTEAKSDRRADKIVDELKNAMVSRWVATARVFNQSLVTGATPMN
ncbi:hypothetical protein GN958_ATG13698 [Phytophthora infestans]|uniref:Uncharacterized protein n=1 Tax=Phytophthora infestans TaxID=4787 RepID=A0A8S9UDR2_PHYIN|nr:hypothetical protein GN958_ATG13698 [Phytophthora infestans]